MPHYRPWQSLVHLPFCVPCPVKPQDPNGVLEGCQIFLIIYKVYSGDCFDIPRIRATQSPIWRKHCVVCYFCNNAMLEKATIPQCTTCGKPLCPNCWGEWHAVYHQRFWGGPGGPWCLYVVGGVAVGHVLFLARTAPTVAKATFRKKVNVMVGS